jgi:hypothetical protein
VIKGEPRRTAEWRGVSISSSLDGHWLLVPSDGQDGLLGPADPIHLLWDIEQQYFTS